MGQRITVSDVEPAHGWLNKLAREAEGDRIFPEEYEFSEVKQLAIQMSDGVLRRKNELHVEASLSEREAEVVALKEGGLTHRGIALVMSVTDDALETIRPSTVDEYVRRARQKYLDAVYTYEHLNEVFFTSGTWVCPDCEQHFELTEYAIPPTECPNCDLEHFLAKGRSK